MAERVDIGYLSRAVMVEDYVIPRNTPITVKKTPTLLVVTVIRGEFEGITFAVTEKQMKKYVTLVL